MKNKITNPYLNISELKEKVKITLCRSRILTNCGNVDAPMVSGGQEMKTLPLANLSQPSCFSNMVARGDS